MALAVNTSASQAHVTVSAFDIHLWSEPFDPANFDPKIHFLWSASDYRKMRDAGAKIALGNLMIFPLKPELDQIQPKNQLGPTARNHFWHRFQVAAATLPAQPATPLGDTREFLWPLRCRPRNFKLGFTASKADAPPNVWTTIWLWPFGWSSTVEFKVTAPFSLADLQDLGTKLRSAASAPFMLNGDALPLSGVFKRMADTVRQELAAPGRAPNHVTLLPRHVVCSLQLPRGMQAPANADGWSAAERMRMLGTLRGKIVQLGELNSGVLFTPLGDRNFAVTDFNEGTLLILRHWKDRSGATRETNHCLFANLRNFSMVYLTLHRFIQFAQSRPAIAGPMENAKAMLSSLPEEYRNGLCINFKKYYAPPG
jgi:hypothetical protein